MWSEQQDAPAALLSALKVLPAPYIRDEVINWKPAFVPPKIGNFAREFTEQCAAERAGMLLIQTENRFKVPDDGAAAFGIAAPVKTRAPSAEQQGGPIGQATDQALSQSPEIGAIK